MQNEVAQRGAQTHDPELKNLMLYRLCKPSWFPWMEKDTNDHLLVTRTILQMPFIDYEMKIKATIGF